MAVVLFSGMVMPAVATEMPAALPEDEEMLEQESVVSEGITIVDFSEGTDPNEAAPTASYPLIYLNTSESSANK